jgi:class 3 adenylate cyclase
VVREHLGLARDLDGTRYTTFVGELARRAGVEPPERFVVNYGTGGAAPPVYSCADLWRCAEAGRQDFFDAAFRGKIVLIGSALDNEDRHVPATRFIGSHYDGPTARCTEPAGPPETRDRVDRFTEPGVFIHAAALDTLLMDGMRLRLPPPLRTAAGTGLASALAAFAFLSLAPLPGALVLVLVVLAVLAGSLWAMLGGVVLPVATLLLAALLSAAIVYVVRFLEELRARRRSEAEKRRMSERFGRYLAPAIIERLADDPNALSLGGDRRRVTVFFSDLVGYTSISEALKDRPEQLVELVNGYFGVMVAIIERHGGYVDKFIGDAVMAVWGAPLPQESQEMKAVAAALACVSALRRFNDEIVVGRHGLPPIGARIGINTGDAIVGNMGAPERLSYTVTGDTVNLASRLEGANKSYGTAIMIGPETAEAVRDGVVLRPLDLLAVKGKRIPVRVYEAVGAAADVGRDALDRIEAYNAALALYAARRFAEAEEAFRRLAGEDAVAALYLARCRAFEAAPPPADWDGSFGLTEK